MKEYTNRGFGIWRIPFTDYEGTTQREFQVQESSLADEAKLWVGVDDVYADLNGNGEMVLMERAHLGVEEVTQLRDALTEWLDGQRNPWTFPAVVDRLIDSTRQEPDVS